MLFDCRRRLRIIRRWWLSDVEEVVCLRWRRLVRSLLHIIRIRRLFHWLGEHL